MRPFEVVGEDLFELLDAVLTDALEPVGEPLVQVGAGALGAASYAASRIS